MICSKGFNATSEFFRLDFAYLKEKKNDDQRMVSKDLTYGDIRRVVSPYFTSDSFYN
jgi:hypothetical protein